MCGVGHCFQINGNKEGFENSMDLLIMRSWLSTVTTSKFTNLGIEKNSITNYKIRRLLQTKAGNWSKLKTLRAL